MRLAAFFGRFDLDILGDQRRVKFICIPLSSAHAPLKEAVQFNSSGGPVCPLYSRSLYIHEAV